jgi:hypothetical protein
MNKVRTYSLSEEVISLLEEIKHTAYDNEITLSQVIEIALLNEALAYPDMKSIGRKAKLAMKVAKHK